MAKPSTRIRERERGGERERDLRTGSERPRLVAHIDPGLHHRLRQAAVERGETRTALVHRALETELTKHEARRRR